MYISSGNSETGDQIHQNVRKLQNPKTWNLWKSGNLSITYGNSNFGAKRCGNSESVFPGNWAISTGLPESCINWCRNVRKLQAVMGTGVWRSAVPCLRESGALGISPPPRALHSGILVVWTRKQFFMKPIFIFKIFQNQDSEFPYIHRTPEFPYNSGPLCSFLPLGYNDTTIYIGVAYPS